MGEDGGSCGGVYELNDEELNLPPISVIVPVYQVKNYIDECLESLLAQTYTNLEIILVDDGSTDGSGEKCDKYAGLDARIRVIHQENQGLSGARNAGLDVSVGEYVAFVDSDDLVLPDYIMVLYKVLNKYQADIAACAYVKGDIRRAGSDAVRGPGSIDMERYADHMSNNAEAGVVCMTSGQMLRQWHGKYKKWETVVWNKLYRKRILDGTDGISAVRFPMGRRYEDVLTSHLIVANAQRIALIMQELYLYRTRPDSIKAQITTSENIRQNLCAQRERMVFFRKRKYWRAYLNLLVGYVLHLGWFWCKKWDAGRQKMGDSKKREKD